VKTEASEAGVYIPPDLAIEIRHWIECSDGEPEDWLFPAALGGCWDHKNYLNRVFKPAAVRAKVGLRDSGKKDDEGNPVFTSDVNSQVLRRHLRHAIRR
jgi:hypothetical protein